MIARSIARFPRQSYRHYSTGASSTPPMLLKIRKDMKTAMQNKDSNRLSVLRALLSQTLNASKTPNPINTDVQMLALLRKSANASKAAAEEFKKAGRQDLVEKEEIQIQIMEGYSSSVEMMQEDDIRRAIQNVVDDMRISGSKLQIGEVLKRVFSPEVLGNAPVEKADVAKIAKAIMADLP